MTSVFKVSKEGFDVRSTDNKNLSYSSLLASHSIFNIVTVYTQYQSEAVIYHNLGFVPKVWVFQVDSDGDGTFYRRIPVIRDGSPGTLDYRITDKEVAITADYPNISRVYKVIIFTRSAIP